MDKDQIRKGLEKIVERYDLYRDPIIIRGLEFPVRVYDKLGVYDKLDIYVHGFIYADLTGKDKDLMTSIKRYRFKVDTSHSLMNLQDVVRYGISIDFGFVLTDDELFIRDYSWEVRDLMRLSYSLIRIKYEDIDSQLYNGVEQLLINLKQKIFNVLFDYLKD